MNSFAKKGAALAACALLVFGLSGWRRKFFLRE